MKTNLYLIGAIATCAIWLAFIPASDEMIEINLVSSTDGNITVCDTIFDPASGYTVQDYISDKGIVPSSTTIIDGNKALSHSTHTQNWRTSDKMSHSVNEIENKTRIGQTVELHKILYPRDLEWKKEDEGINEQIKLLTWDLPDDPLPLQEDSKDFSFAIVTIHDFLLSEPAPDDDDDLDPLSTEELRLPIENLKIYPNPTNGNLKLNFFLPERGQSNFAVYDIAGKEVYTQNLGNFQGQFNQNIDLTHLSPGTYIMRVTQNNLSKTEKLMVN